MPTSTILVDTWLARDWHAACARPGGGLGTGAAVAVPVTVGGGGGACGTGALTARRQGVSHITRIGA